MTTFYYMIRSAALLVLTLLELMMFLRAIMSWFPQVQGNKFHQMMVMLTEPIIMPFRALVERIPALRGFPLDISFSLAFLTLIVLETIL